MKKQSYLQYIKTRIKFQAEVACFNEFDVIVDVPVKQIKDEELRDKIGTHGDLHIVCMKLAPVIRKSPQQIAQTIKPYLEQVYGIERVDILNGYLNIYFDRQEFLKNAILDTFSSKTFCL